MATRMTSSSLMSNGSLMVFSGRSTTELTTRICKVIDPPVQPGGARVIEFPDGEIFVKLEEDVRVKDCYVVVSTCEPVNDNLMELLIFIDTMRRASAGRITVVMPYMG